MRMWIVAAMVVIAVLAFFAWSKREEPAQSRPSVTAEDVKRETGEALETAKDYMLQDREEYQKQIESKLRQIDQRIEALKKKAEEKRVLEELQKKRETAQQKLRELRVSSAEAWNKFRPGLEAALEELEKASKQALDQFS